MNKSLNYCEIFLPLRISYLLLAIFSAFFLSCLHRPAAAVGMAESLAAGEVPEQHYGSSLKIRTGALFNPRVGVFAPIGPVSGF